MLCMSEPGSSPAEASSKEPDKVAGKGLDIVARTELYKLAYEIGVRALVDQQNERKGTRDWAVQFTAFVGAGTFVLIATGIHASNRSAFFYVLMAIASALSILLLVLLLALFQSSRTWTGQISASSLIENWIEAEIPAPDEGSFLRGLAETYDAMHRRNQQVLGRDRAIYRWVIIVGSLQGALWVVLVLARI